MEEKRPATGIVIIKAPLIMAKKILIKVLEKSKCYFKYNGYKASSIPIKDALVNSRIPTAQTPPLFTIALISRKGECAGETVRGSGMNATRQAAKAHKVKRY